MFFEPFGCIAVFLQLSFSICLDSVHQWIVRGCLRHRAIHWRGPALTQAAVSLFTISSGHLQQTWRSSRQGITLWQQSFQVYSVVAHYPWGSVSLFSCFSCFLKWGRQGSFRKETGSVLFSSPLSVLRMGARVCSEKNECKVLLHVSIFCPARGLHDSQNSLEVALPWILCCTQRAAVWQWSASLGVTVLAACFV